MPHGIAGLLRRVLGARAAEFTTAPLPAPESGDVFEVAAEGGRVELRGSSPVAQACALRWYLTRVCGTDLSWDTAVVEPPDRLPSTAPVRRGTGFAHRTHFNYCTFSYTTAFWDWRRWERQIDWMAMHGVTTPLALTGQEAVWQAVLRGLGMADDATRDFLGGSGYLPFTWMGCTEHWGGPLPQPFIDARADLGRRIIERERELGMSPVLQAFAGHLPEQLGAGHRMRWFEFSSTLLDPLSAEFRAVGARFMAEQTRRFGSGNLYAADPFIEMVPPDGSPEALAAIARAVHEPMVAADPGAVWLLQSWPFAYKGGFWTAERIRAFLTAVPDEHLLVQDLWAEQRPLWKETAAFHGKPWVWCMLHNFGGRPGMHGKPAAVAAGLAEAAGSPDRGRFRGAGLTMEAEGADPAVYAHFADLLWEPEPPDLPEWFRGFARRRYGRPVRAAEDAWGRLLATVYAAERTGSPQNSAVVARPRVTGDLSPAEPPHPGSGPPEWEPADLVDAWRLLLDAAPEAAGADRYGRDLADVTAQVLAVRARELRAETADAFRSGDPAATDKSAAAFLGLLGDLGELLATRREFLLGPWLADARAQGTTEAERRLHEWNARRLITVWGRAGSRLHDYSGRHWSGLVEGYHLPRWRLWTQALAASLAHGTPLDPEAFDAELTAFEEGWCRGGERYATEPRGDTVAVARRLFAAYAYR
ncbi:alpha-N-acetylglucosaminidase [Murinocardiopsis flavida]|uniref:Alpha-N-acetylglucosaminidase n=1 Tax=Murinocardiopsis flavida TaxID=645275 RepID=A0A2P8DFH3_9ACTN|nr:alpha-N-acetylglucosaminidase [Murinocardiopsis flavida]PSK95953.1 alpha-N-acetylglucosaminidase [Murinocardiopsis flavida]